MEEATDKNVVLVDNLELEVNAEVKLASLISDKNEVEILNGNEVVDTSKLGKIEYVVKYKDNDKEKEFKFSATVIDSKNPVIKFSKKLETNVNKEIDLLKNVSVNDNSLEDLTVNVVGDYDFSKVGTYNLKYVATDSSNNKVEEDFVLEVKKGAEPSIPTNTNYNYSNVDMPSGNKKLVGTSTKGYSIYDINGLTYIEDYLIVNKTYALPKDFEPSDTYKSYKGVKSQCGSCINDTAYKAWLDMKSDAAALGLNLWIQSGYRPYSLQVSLYNRYVKRDGKEKADTYSARAGHSEHQTALCFDLNTITNFFANTKEGKWVNENAMKYGYIIRYPKGKESKTGYQYEPWHIRYVGSDLAKKLYNNGNWITMEEYFGISSEYSE